MKKLIDSVLSLLLLFAATACEERFDYYTDEENSDKANTVFYYTTTNSKPVDVYDSYSEKIDVISNVYTNGTGKLVIRGKYSYVPSYIFLYCTNLKSIVIPEGIEELRGFYGCSSLTDIRLPKSLEIISSKALAGTGLTSLVLPEKVSLIYYDALPDLSVLYVKAAVPPTIYGSSNGFYNDIARIYVPVSALGTYKGYTGWRNYSTRIFGYDFVNDRPAAKEVVTGKYHFLSFVNSDNQKLYNTMTVEKTGNGTYEITNLLFPNGVKWEAVYDEENSCLVLSGKCSFVNIYQESVTFDNGFMYVYSTSNDETRAYFVSSWPSKSLHYDEDYDGTTPCVINVNPNTGLLESFDTYLAGEVYEYDNTTGEFGNHLGYSLQVVEPTIYQGEKPYSYQSSLHRPLNVSAPKKSFTARKAVELEAIVDNDSE